MSGNVRLILLAGVLIVSGSALTSCKKAAPETAAEPEPLATATPLPTAPAAPASPALPIAAAATPVAEPLAPPGIFFLLQKTSITTEDGIIGLRPGQSLRQVSPGIYEVNGQTVQLRDDQVTNNLRIARQFAAADATTQAALRQALQPPKAPVPVRTTPPSAGIAAAAATPAPRPVLGPTPVPTRNSLSGGSKLGTGTGTADPEMANRKNVKVDASGRQYWRDSRGAIRYDF